MLCRLKLKFNFNEGRSLSQGQKQILRSTRHKNLQNQINAAFFNEACLSRMACTNISLQTCLLYLNSFIAADLIKNFILLGLSN